MLETSRLVTEPIDRSCQVRDRFCGEDLAGARGATKSGRHIESRAPEPTFNRHRLPGVHSDSRRHRQAGLLLRLMCVAELKINGGPQRLTGRWERCQRFVSAQLNDLPAEGCDSLACELRKDGGQLGCRLIAALLGEGCVTPYVGDEKGTHMDGSVLTRFVTLVAWLFEHVSYNTLVLLMEFP